MRAHPRPNGRREASASVPWSRSPPRRGGGPGAPPRRGVGRERRFGAGVGRERAVPARRVSVPGRGPAPAQTQWIATHRGPGPSRTSGRASFSAKSCHNSRFWMNFCATGPATALVVVPQGGSGPLRTAKQSAGVGAGPLPGRTAERPHGCRTPPGTHRRARAEGDPHPGRRGRERGSAALRGAGPGAPPTFGQPIRRARYPRLGSAVDVGDAAQEAMVRAWRSVEGGARRHIDPAKIGPPSLPDVEGWMRCAPAAFTDGRAGQP